MTEMQALADKLADMVMKQRTVPVASCLTQVWGDGETVAMQVVTKAGEHIDVSFGVGADYGDDKGAV